MLWDRLFAYAAAMGAARRAVTMLSLGAEDDHRAWSQTGGRWRRVRVRYPRAWPPAWGKHPALAILLALAWGGAAGVAIYWLADLASSRRDPSLGFSQETFDWTGRIALVAIGCCALLLLWAVWILVRAVPDLWSSKQVTGEIVRDRRRSQVFKSGNDPKYWYYLAVDDGTSERIRGGASAGRCGSRATRASASGRRSRPGCRTCAPSRSSRSRTDAAPSVTPVRGSPAAPR